MHGGSRQSMRSGKYPSLRRCGCWRPISCFNSRHRRPDKAPALQVLRKQAHALSISSGSPAGGPYRTPAAPPYGVLPAAPRSADQRRCGWAYVRNDRPFAGTATSPWQYRSCLRALPVRRQVGRQRTGDMLLGRSPVTKTSCADRNGDSDRQNIALNPPPTDATSAAACANRSLPANIPVAPA